MGPSNVSQLKVSKPTDSLKRLLSTIITLMTLLLISLTIVVENQSDKDVNRLLKNASPELKVTSSIVWRLAENIATVGYNFTTHFAVIV